MNERAGIGHRLAVLLAALAVAGDPAALAAVSAHAQAGPATGHYLDEELSRLATPREPGCVVGAEREGRIVYIAAAGAADLEQDRPIDAHTVFQTGSVTKSVTAYAVLLLAERGSLSLDDSIRRFLPEFPAYGNAVTIRHLLQHVSGIKDEWDLRLLFDPRPDLPLTTDDMLAIVMRQPGLNFAPGTQYLYSNSGYTILARIVERASGSSLSSFARREIFEPLGMTSTLLVDDLYLIVPHRATGYLPRQEGGLAAIPIRNTPGPTNLHTNVEDLLRWTHNLYAPNPASEPIVRQMREQTQLPSGQRVNYGLGLSIGRYKGQPVLFHMGAERGYLAEIFVLPESRFSAVALCNRWNVDSGGLVRRLADRVLSLPEPAATASAAPQASPDTAIAPAELAAVAGTYRSPATGIVRQIEARDGALVWTRSNTRLVPRGPFSYRLGEIVVIYSPARGREPARVVLREAGEPDVVYARARPFRRPAAGMAAYEGNYHSDDLDVDYCVRAQAGEIVISGPHGLTGRGMPAFSDAFRVDYLETLVAFHRDSRQRIIGFDISTSRARNVAFRRAGPPSSCSG
jgi:CubicO group peptidase (beta-lactamase class C family)